MNSLGFSETFAERDLVDYDGYPPPDGPAKPIPAVFVATNSGVDASSEAVLESNLTTVFLPIIYIIIFIVGLPCNAMAIWVFLFRTKKKNPASIFMVNLALADLLFIIWLPLKISYHFNGNNWIFGEPLCKVLVGFFYGNMYCSTIFIACISVQRYWAIVHPFSQQKKNNCAAVCVSLCVWLIVWLLTTPLYLYDQTLDLSNLNLNLNITTCHDAVLFSEEWIPNVYFLTMGVVGFIVPGVVCIVAYMMTFRVLENSVTNSNNTKSKRKAMILMVIVLVMFVVCFTPSNILLIVHYSLQVAKISNNAYGFYIATLCLCSFNSCIDPFLYYFISEDFRENCWNVLRCRSERKAKRMKISYSKVASSSAGSPIHSTSLTVVE